MAQTDAELPRERIAQAIGRLWWLPLLRGIFMIILGGYALFRPGMTIGAFAQVIGFFIIADGILAVVAAIMGQVPSRFWFIVRGVLEVLAGLFVFANPFLVAGLTATFVLYTVAFSSILCGIFEIVAAVQDRKQIEGAGWLVLGGAMSVLFGILVLMAPLSFGLLMVRVIGAFAILLGISMIGFAFQVRGLGKALAD